MKWTVKAATTSFSISSPPRSSGKAGATQLRAQFLYFPVLIYVPRKRLWFDADVETGNNLGRFANQPGVLEAFTEIKRLSNKDLPHLTAGDWINVETVLYEQCNACYEFKVCNYCKGNVLRRTFSAEKRNMPWLQYYGYVSEP